MANDLLTGTARLRAASNGSRKSAASAAVFWGVALMAGLGAAFLIARYLDNRTVTVGAPTQKVIVAAVDLPLATRLKGDQVKLIDWPVASLPPGAIQDAKDVVDRVLTARVVKGEPILTGRLASKDGGNGLTALIPADMRAMAVRVDDVVGVAGFVHPDDRVDVIVTMRPPRPSDAEPTSKLILQNVRVLAVGKELDSSEKERRTATSATVATLLVSPSEAEKLALASSEGRLILTLRGWTDEQAVVTAGMFPSSLLSDVSRPPNAAPPTPPASEARARPSESTAANGSNKSRVSAGTSRPQQGTETARPARKDAVEILRGDRFEERRFDGRE